ncbi:MAG: PqqD family peptide modification chaperone [Candidatus Aminicenantes bacterium]|nr:PqqD family peptide modification chaperone [Candidatus Aminicenantes bacterium]
MVLYGEIIIKNTELNPESKYIRSGEISVSLVENGAVLFNPDSFKEQYLNQTALFIWKSLNGQKSIRDIADNILRDFNSAPVSDVNNDISTLVGELKEIGFVRESKENERISDEEYPDKRDGPENFDISLTGKCNLHCDYCFYAEEMHNRPDLSKEEWFSFFDELGSLAVRNLTLSGGELFVRKDLWEIIDNVIKNRMRYSILSNGTLITEDTLKHFEFGKRRSRLNSIQVSIDGSCAEIHDKSRGEGSFVKAINGLRLLKDAGFPVTSRVTINRYNVDDLENITKLLLEDVGLNGFGVNDAIPMGAGCDNQSDITLLPAQQLNAIKIMHELDERYKGRINAAAGPLAKWKMYGELEHAKATGEKSERFQMGYLTACGCMYNKLSVHHDGVVSPCNMLPGLEMGKINKDSIKTLWKNHQALKDLKERRKIPMSEVPGCENCEWVEFCNGSCPGLPYTITGNLNKANMHDCYRKFLNETKLSSSDVPWYK